MQPKLLSFSIPFPPSVNHYYRRVGSKTLISKRGREYHHHVQAAVWLSNSIPTAQTGPLSVDITACPPDKRKRDLDNLLKATLDSLTRAGVWIDDHQVREIQIRWGSVAAQGKLDVCIKCL